MECKIVEPNKHIIYMFEYFQIEVYLLDLSNTNTTIPVIKVRSNDEIAGTFSGVLYPDIIYMEGSGEFAINTRMSPLYLLEEDFEMNKLAFERSMAFVREANAFFAAHDWFGNEKTK